MYSPPYFELDIKGANACLKNLHLQITKYFKIPYMEIHFRTPDEKFVSVNHLHNFSP